MLGNLRPDEARAGAECPELPEGGVTGEIFHPAIGRWDEPVRRHVPEPGADARRHLLHRVDGGVAEVDHAEDDGLAGEIGQDAQVQLGLRGLDGDLCGDGIRELGEKRVAGGFLVPNNRRIAEAEV